MAKSAYEYVKLFEVDDRLPLCTWTVIRIDGHDFYHFTRAHSFEHPNDIRALRLMNDCAAAVMSEWPDIVISYGVSDEYSFVLHPNSSAYDRRRSKLISLVVSRFTAEYSRRWPQHFDNIPLRILPTFDARTVSYPTDKHIKDYLRWRQVDCHINNLYNTTYWALRQQANITAEQAHAALDKTNSAQKNEMLFSQFGINYNNQPAMYRKGSILIRNNYLATQTMTAEATPTTDTAIVTASSHSSSLPTASPASSSDPNSGTDNVNGISDADSKGARRRRTVICIHEDLIDDSFYTERHVGIIPHIEMGKAALKATKSLKRQQYKLSHTSEEDSHNPTLSNG